MQPKIRINHFIVRDPRVKTPIKLAHISDTHNDFRILHGLRKIIYSEKLDYVCITGDLLDRANCGYTPVMIFLRRLQEEATVVVSLGNHEKIAMSGKGKPKRRFYENVTFYEKAEALPNCIFLRDTFSCHEATSGVTFGAINPPGEYFESCTKSESRAMFARIVADIPAKKLNPNHLNILLSHSPEHLISKGKLLPVGAYPELDPFVLILCGHMHGSLMPKLLQRAKSHRGLVGPHGIFPKDSFGYWNNSHASLILTDGATKIAEGTSVPRCIREAVNRLYCPDVEIISLENGPQHQLARASSITQPY